MASSQSSLQDTFLNSVRKNRNPVTLFLVNGVKLQGVITWFDNFSILLKRDSHIQLVYKHSISTIMPSESISLGIEKTVDCERIGMAVVGLEVPHVHIHLIPINSMNDMNFSNSLELKKQDFEHLSNKIKNNI